MVRLKGAIQRCRAAVGAAIVNYLDFVSDHDDDDDDEQ